MAYMQYVSIAIINIKKGFLDDSYTREPTVVQYTVSNCGSLQLILNRCMYYLRYTNRDGRRQWRCVDYVKKKCPAFVVTKDDIVLQRVAAHIHSFHDKKILRKVKLGLIFTAIHDAESEGNVMKVQRSK